MNIIVCIKQVPDTTEVKLDPITGTLIRDGVPSIMNPDDKAGLEVALTLKDKFDAHVSVITMGLPQAKEVLREALAMGADDAYLITDRALGGADTLATSTTLAAAIKNLDYDLIITGRQAIDGDTAQVGPQIAEHLGIPNISYAAEVEYIGNDTFQIVRLFDDMHHVLSVKSPCLITALGETTTPRYMTPGGIFDAYNTEITVWNRGNLDVEDNQIGLVGSPTKVRQSFPKSVKAKGVKYTDLSATEAADRIVKELKDKYIVK